MTPSKSLPLATGLRIVEVAVPVPMRQSFDFLLGDEMPLPPIGARVLVPFGRRSLTAIVLQNKSETSVPTGKLKAVKSVLDNESIFDADLWPVLRWLSNYYLAPIGDVLETALPVKLRQGTVMQPVGRKAWELSGKGRGSPIDELEKAPLQRAIIERFMQSDRLSSDDFKTHSSGWRQAVNALVGKGWLHEVVATPSPQSNPQTGTEGVLELNAEQSAALTELQAAQSIGNYVCSLLHGVTGSGKTEVYFGLMRDVLAAGRQVLLMVPEIGLTPQLIRRVEQALDYPVTMMHSGLNDSERHLAWWHARSGEAKIIIGTRSAIFSSFDDLGLIVVDEEHDGSFKQADGVRYHARDVAIYRARQHGIPIVLGSATPSLESFHNARSGRYRYLTLTERATKASLPQIELLDTRVLPAADGLSPPLVAALGEALAAGQQAMIFLNRRGYAPVLYCADCGHTSKCQRCDAHLTLHRLNSRMRCHHCGYEGRQQTRCQTCQSDNLVEVGEGTQRVEDALNKFFPTARIMRIDRDTTRRRGELASMLEEVRDGDVDILLGTQLVTKGHDFPKMALVGVLGCDAGLYSTDFRASEIAFQLLVQVAGRAGRRDSAGRVLVQTAFPDHPFFSFVRNHDYRGFAQHLLNERQQTHYPPFAYFALLRAESTHQARALQFLRRTRTALQAPAEVQVMDPVPASMERRAGRYRAQLLLSASARAPLHECLNQWLAQIGQEPELRKLAASVRWSLDIDPMDLY